MNEDQRTAKVHEYTPNTAVHEEVIEISITRELGYDLQQGQGIQFNVFIKDRTPPISL
jgi:hypothetical protein